MNDEAVAPRLFAPSAPSASTVAKSRSPLAAKSDASLPSTLSEFRPVATPVALVVNGAPVVSPTSMRPASLPTVSNSNARPPLRLLPRRHGSLPVFERQP